MVTNQLRCDLAAADALHFERAAQSLDMLPATLGRQIKHLEDHLGVRLFQRTTRAVSLTEVGSLILEDARQLASDADNFERRGRDIRAPGFHSLIVGATDMDEAGIIRRSSAPLALLGLAGLGGGCGLDRRTDHAVDHDRKRLADR